MIPVISSFTEVFSFYPIDECFLCLFLSILSYPNLFCSILFYFVNMSLFIIVVDDVHFVNNVISSLFYLKSAYDP